MYQSLREARSINLLTYLNNNNFQIPIYQRDFVWKKNEIEDFLKEVIEVHENLYEENNLKNDIFAGTIYLKYDNFNKSWEIIDGQQRTSFFYFLKCYFLSDKTENQYSIVNLLEKLKFDKNEILEKTKIIINNKIKNIQIVLDSFKLESLNKNFENNNINNIKEFNNKLKIINNIFKDYFLDKLDNNILEIIEFIIFLFDSITLVEIKAKPNDDINDIFTSVNSKGVPLTNWDLIRNEIYKKMDFVNSVDDINEKIKLKNDFLIEIDEKINIFSDSENKLNIDPEYLIWAYLIFKKNNTIKKSEIVKEFNLLLDRKIFSLKEFKEDLTIFCENILTSYKNPDEVDEYQLTFYILKELNIKQLVVPVLYYLMSINFDKLRLKNALYFFKKILSNFIYAIILNNNVANIFERFFKNEEVIKSIINWNTDSLEWLIEKSDFRKININLINSYNNLGSDNDRISILKLISKNKSLLKIYLWLSCNNIDDHKKIIKFINSNYEYVLPKTFNIWKNNYEYWFKLSDIEIKKYLNQIGNIVLLPKDIDSKFKTDFFDKKIQNYFTNDLNELINNNISLSNIFINFSSETKEWTPKLIEERTNIISNEILRLIEANL